MKGKTTTAPLKKENREKYYFIFFLFFMCIAGLFYLLKPPFSGYSVISRNWGFDFLKYYDLPYRLVICAMAFLLILPAVSMAILIFSGSFLDQLKSPGKLKHVFFICVAALFVLLFYCLRVKYFFLGDFNLRLEQVMRKEFLSSEYLTMRLLYIFTSLGIKWGFTSYQMFKLYSILMGGVYVLIACYISDLLGQNRLNKVLLFLVQIASSLLLFFCGYIEIYATPAVFLLLFVYAGLRYLKFRKHFFTVLICLALAISAHLICLITLPAACVAFYFVNREKYKVLGKLSAQTILFLVTSAILLTLLGLLGTPNAFTLPIKAPEKFPTYMTLFSFRHFWEYLNGLLLSCGISLLVFILLFFIALRKKVELNAEIYFLIYLTLGGLGLIYLLNLHRGSSDWDLMAFPAISLNLLTTLFVFKIYGISRISHYLLFSVVALNSIHAALWMHINHTDKSIKKIENMLINDPGTYYLKLPSIVELTILYKANNLWPDAERIALVGCNANDLNACIIYGKNLLEAGKKDQARVFYEELLRRSKFVPEAYIFLLEDYEAKGEKDKLVECLYNLYNTYVQMPDFYLTRVQPEVFIGLFEYLYTIESQYKNEKNLMILSNVIANLKTKKKPVANK